MPLCLAGPTRATSASSDFGHALLDWALISLAMMTPLTLRLLHHVIARSFASRRHRGAALFMAGALVPWLVAGLVGLMLLAAVPVSAVGTKWLGAGSLLLATMWQLSPMKRAALRRCQLALPLAAWGRRSDADCLLQGVVHARACMASCWALMVAMTLAPGHLAVAACVQGIVLAERRNRNPLLARSAVALALAASVAPTAALFRSANHLPDKPRPPQFAMAQAPYSPAN